LGIKVLNFSTVLNHLTPKCVQNDTLLGQGGEKFPSLWERKLSQGILHFPRRSCQRNGAQDKPGVAKNGEERGSEWQGGRGRQEGQGWKADQEYEEPEAGPFPKGMEGVKGLTEGYAPEEKKGWDRPKTNESRRV